MTEQLLTAVIVAIATAYCVWIALPSAARGAASRSIARLATRFGMGPARAGRMQAALARQSACSECASCKGCASREQVDQVGPNAADRSGPENRRVPTLPKRH